MSAFLIVAVLASIGPVNAAPPSVTTLAPGVSATTALLFGQVNPNGKSTLWSLSYALAGLPLAAACSGDIPMGLNVLHTISCTVTGLTPSTNYHVRANGLNADGEGHGADLAFTTLAASTTAGGPPIVSLTFPIVEETSATLYGTVNPNGLATNWQFFAGPDGTRSPQCGGSLPSGGSAVTVHCTLANLTPGTTYTYLLRGTNAGGTADTPINSFTTRVSTTTTGPVQSDWAVLSTSMNPPSPHIGDAVKFSITLTLLSTNAPLPQPIHVQCVLDGALCGEGTITYPGPVGASHQVNTEAFWMATEGTHTVTWTISSDNDPNSSNNSASQTFAVPSAETPTQTTTTQTEATTTAQATSQETTETQSSVTQPTIESTQTTQQQTSPVTVTVISELTGGVMDMIQQNTLPIVGALVVIVALLAILAVRRGKHATTGLTSPSETVRISPSRTSTTFCGHCGASNPSTHEFCSKCGSRLS